MAWRRSAAFLWLLACAGCALFLAWRFASGPAVETDLMELLPASERNATAEAAVRALAGSVGNRAVLLVGHPEQARAGALAAVLAERLRASGAFKSVIGRLPPVDVEMPVRTYKPYQPYLLRPDDAARLASPGFDPQAALLQRLHQPFRTGPPTDPALDPFGFLQRWVAALPSLSGKMGIDDGMLGVSAAGMHYRMVLVEPQGNAFDGAVQQRAGNAIRAAEAALRADAPQAALLRAGALFYGEAARQSAEREVDLIGGGSLIGVALLLWLLFRSLRPLAFGLATVAIGIACGVACVLLAYPKIHLITLVFGASLTGEAIDYAIQYFAVHLDEGPRWDPHKALERILPGVTVALATSLVGYGALTLTPFPAISQIALFAFSGLLAAWLSVVLLLPRWVRRPSTRDIGQALRMPRMLMQAWKQRFSGKRALWAAALLTVLCIPGWLQLRADDDIRQLVTRPDDLARQEKQIQSLTGLGGSGRFLLVEGADDEQALQRDEALAARLRGALGRGIAGYAALSDSVPSQRTQQQNRELLERRLPPETVSPLFEALGFPDAAAENWRRAKAAPPPLTLAAWKASPLSLPLRHQIVTRAGGGSALIVNLHGDDGSLDLDALAAGLPGVSVVDKARSVSQTFARYRQLSLLWLPLAIAIVTGILVLRYGARKGLAALAPNLAALGAALAVYGYLGLSVTLFTMMAAVLVLGVGVNYAIFVVEAGDQRPAPFAGVLLSAATTILSFGLLALSATPALRQFGVVLLLGVSGSVALAPLALRLGERR